MFFSGKIWITKELLVRRFSGFRHLLSIQLQFISAEISWIAPKVREFFFGFSANKLHILPPHTKLGSVPMRYLEKSICDRNLWWAHNSMDKIYLPITESYGPRSYDECTLLFEKTKNCFMISICSSVDASKYRLKSKQQSLLYSMSQGREFGFICD